VVAERKDNSPLCAVDKDEVNYTKLKEI